MIECETGASKNLKVGSISDEFDYAAIETDEIEIRPIQFASPLVLVEIETEVQQDQCMDILGLTQHRWTSLMNQNQAKVEKILTFE